MTNLHIFGWMMLAICIGGSSLSALELSRGGRATLAVVHSETASDACKESAMLSKKNFIFDYLDVQNDPYNPKGKHNASSYKFPYDDGRFDVIFLVSVLAVHWHPSERHRA